MKSIVNFIFVMALLATASLVLARDEKKDDAPKKPKGKITISKETTYVTGPLDKDGYIDYAAALNERVSRRMSRRGMI